MPWSDQPDFTPDDVRCCPENANPTQLGDDCLVEGWFGSCIDDCAKGLICLDTDDDGMGTCQAFCRGSPENPICDADETCFIHFGGIPICFVKCDPFAQDCGEGWGCYPDEAMSGTGFICLPTISGELAGDACWLLSNCEPGLMCVSPEFYPDCTGVLGGGCCTSMCDISEVDDCASIHPDLECVSWYMGMDQPPSPDLENVGVCAIPP